MKKTKYKYLPADKTIRFNDNPLFPDSDIEPFDWEIPVACPPLDEIDGYGLAPEDQYFSKFRPKMSAKLKEINLRLDLIPSQKVDLLLANPEYYRDEINFILKEWDKRIDGYWFFNLGKPTYITCDHYFFLAYYPIDGRLPQYRERDREDYLFQMMCELDTKCFGDNYPKMRREGATNRRSAKRLNRATSDYNHRSGLQSKNYDHAEEVHAIHIMNNFKKLPFFFIPVWDANYRNTTSINFFAPNTQSHPDVNRIDVLESILDFKDSSVTGYDGLKLKYLHNDESGKLLECNILERWQTQKLCLLDNGIITGKSSHTSTVEEMERLGGQNFKDLCDQSHYLLPKNNNGKIFARDESGATITGLFNHFIPSYQGLVLYDSEKKKYSIDKYGKCDIAWTSKWIVDEGKRLREAKDVTGFIKHCRQFPLQWKDCWRISAAECKFDIAKLDDRIEFFKYNGNPFKVKGDLEWENEKFGKVKFVVNPGGKFWCSYQFDNPEKEANLRFQRDNIWFPMNTNKFIAGADPIRYLEGVEGRKKDKSDGGIAVFRKRNLAIDPDGKDVSQWESYRFCLTYRNRPTQDVYCEDVLKACIYYGCEVFTETNIEAVAKYFIDNGFSGYLYHKLQLNHTVKIEAGEQTSAKTKEDIYAYTDTYIKNHCAREVHDEYLTECKFIVNDMSPWDLFVACGKCLQAANDSKFHFEDVSAYDISDVFPTILIEN